MSSGGKPSRLRSCLILRGPMRNSLDRQNLEGSLAGCLHNLFTSFCMGLTPRPKRPGMVCVIKVRYGP